MTITATARTAEQYCTFWVSGLFFGVAVDEVQEVLRLQPMTPVPRADEAVTGLINLRGQIVTAVDLRVRLGLPARAAGEVPMNVIVRSRGEVVSLLVDDIGDVIDTAGVDAQPAPSNMPKEVQDVVRGVRPLPDTILLVLDADRAVDVATTPDTTGGNP
ncbi:purine-binding chemotaxis protein CheW [Nocardioides aromaticivorans]|uniref:Chemotaxis protein CheW n=1 Tax=Nocardioides aromaticivorans TaxID=200618 RepID=A0A7Y9ZL56_9ACTN|nr:chemotaxis protein CheW [Nocardioides aromaticivorans]NYI45925.1 purine-binding chemotaxis protein CheW [Nocardioides aromaticivorans]QSR25056.1 chemotaxis protein CheW [Nocardioides aromaticivorans]